MIEKKTPQKISEFFLHNIESYDIGTHIYELYREKFNAIILNDYELIVMYI